MKAVLFLACLSLLVLGSFGVPRRSSINYGYRYNRHRTLTKDQVLAPTNDAAAAAEGILMPRPGCVMTWEQFQANVIGKDWIGIYDIDDDDFEGHSYKFRALWTNNGTGIRRQGTIWDDINSECLLADALFERDSPTLAQFKLLQGSSVFANPDRVDYFLSCDPSSYFIFYICQQTPVNGRCPEAEVILMVPDKRPLESPVTAERVRVGTDPILNDVPWTKIEYQFKTCIDQLFVDSTDPQLEWLWQKEECPHPNSPSAMALK